MIPVRSGSLSKPRRARILAEARAFHTKGLFIQECTNPKFLRALAGDFIESLARLKLQRYVAGQFAQQALDCYFARLEQGLASDAAATLKRTQAFLSVTTKKNRVGPEKKQYVAVFPDDYAENVISEFSRLIARLFRKPTRNTTANFWLMYTKWIWTNQMAQAMEDLEKQIGPSQLEKMKSKELFAEVLRIYATSGTGGPELARLTEWYLREFASLAVAPLRELPLDEFEVILLLRRHKTSRLVVLADLGAQIDAVLKRPQEIYSVPPRRFEELMAFALSESGYEEVQLTAQTRDGGYDIDAIRNGPTRERLIVECKRYNESRKVGRPALDALLGVLHREKANQALLATTSSFSKDALELFKREPWRLQGMDIENVMKLLGDARRN